MLITNLGLKRFVGSWFKADVGGRRPQGKSVGLYLVANTEIRAAEAIIDFLIAAARRDCALARAKSAAFSLKVNRGLDVLPLPAWAPVRLKSYFSSSPAGCGKTRKSCGRFRR